MQLNDLYSFCVQTLYNLTHLLQRVDRSRVHGCLQRGEFVYGGETRKEYAYIRLSVVKTDKHPRS